MNRSNDESVFLEVVDEWLVEIDAHLCDTKVPIPQRPFLAADLFIRNAIIEVTGHKKSDYLSSEWFRSILKPIRKWYLRKYGAALEVETERLLAAVCMFGDYFLVSVPTAIRRDDEDGTYWITFPTEVDDDEDPRQWVQKCPILNAAGNREHEGYLNEIRRLGSSVRKIHARIMYVQHPDEVAKQLAKAVVVHLSSAARSIVQNTKSPVGLAVWDVHQAVEKSIKLLVRHQGKYYVRTHDLMALAAAVDGGCDECALATLQKFPSSGRAIEMRMGEGAPVSVAEAYGHYLAAVDFLVSFASRMPRKFGVEGARFQMRKLPWQIEE